MKKGMKFLSFASLIISTSLFLGSCGNTTKSEGLKDSTMANMEGMEKTVEHSGEHTYACPMHPEVTGKQGDKCPKCGMKLEHNDNAGKGNGNTYKMEFKANPTMVEAGKAAMLSFTPKIVGKETEAVPLDVHHEKKLHLIVVSKDLSYFTHIHPEYKASGSYDISVLAKGKAYTNGAEHSETVFEKGGDYMLFADYFPSGGNNQIEKINLNVGGSAYTPVAYAAPRLASTVDGYTLTLMPESGKFEAGKLAHIEGVLTQNGKAVDANTLENYLGAKAHMVVIGVEEKQYLHVHPEVVNGKYDLHTTFEKAGVYRGWVQFQSEGKVHTADFVIVVK